MKVRGKGRSLEENIRVWINDLDDILTIPAAAYSLHPDLSYTIKRGHPIIDEIRNVIKKGEHPIQTYKILTGNDNIPKEILGINKYNLSLAIQYAINDLRGELKEGKVSLHTFFKTVGAMAAYLYFNRNFVLVSRYQSYGGNRNILQ